ncbi:MAG: ABC transporter ATP-binding protein [Bdellovibrionales bacterium]
MPEKTAPLLNVENVSVSYDGANPVIHDINMAPQAGEFYGLIGLNGAGKTTLIKAILGLREQDAGKIEIFGKPCTDQEAKKNLAFLPERFEPPWFLSGLEFLRFSMRLYGQRVEDKVFYEYAEKVALDPDALKRRVQTYSKGMRQKLGLLGTVLTNCKLLILDEPMSGLDPKARTLVKDMLLEIKAADRTVFLSSHILADMDEICDRVSVMHNGTIGFSGPPKDLKQQTGCKNLERAFLHFIEKPAAA